MMPMIRSFLIAGIDETGILVDTQLTMMFNGCEHGFCYDALLLWHAAYSALVHFCYVTLCYLQIADHVTPSGVPHDSGLAFRVHA